MIATLVNCATVIIGSLIGVILHRRINESFKRVVYVGETHTAWGDHLLQLEVLKAMATQPGELALGVEWFQAPFQPVVDRYLAGEIDEKAALAAAEAAVGLAIGALEREVLSQFLVEAVLLSFLGGLVGVIIGALPGLGATTGAALLLPFTLTMDPVHAIAVLATIYCSATFAGSITAILINTPGPSAAAARIVPSSVCHRW